MKALKLLRLFFVVALAIGCSKKSSDTIDLRYLPVKLAGSERWSMVDIQTGEILYKDEFKEQPSAVINDFFYVQNGDKKYDFYNIKSVTAPINPESYTDVTQFNKKGLAFAVKEGSTVSIINTQCKEVAVFPEDLKVCYNNDIDENLFLFRDWDDKYGFADYKGNIVIPAKYDSGAIFSKDGYACVGVKNDNDTYTYSVIDKTGTEHLSFSSKEYENFTEFQDELMTVQKESEVYCINLKGEKVLHVGKSKDFSLYQMTMHGDKIIFSDGVLFGLKDKKGEILIRAKYDDLQFDGDNYIAEKNEKYGVINAKDEILIPFDYSEIDRLSTNRYLVQTDKLSAIVDGTNKDIGTNNFEATSFFRSYYVRSNFFNAVKIANSLCNNFSVEECSGYKADTKLGDEDKWVAEVEKYVYLYSDRKSLSSTDVHDYSSPTRIFNFDKYLTHEKYRYFYGYRFSDGREATSNAKLVYIELQESIKEYNKSAEQQFVDAMGIVLPERGFTDNGKGIFISENGSAVSVGYDDGNAIVRYYFKSSDATASPKNTREDKKD